MFNTASRSPAQHRGFTHVFKAERLSLGLLFPIEAFQGDKPSMLFQVELAKRAEILGFSALWFRDVPLRDPNFGDVGQIYDPWVYLGYIAAHTQNIALGTASIVLPLRHPLHTAKAAASVDQLSDGRLVMGIASGDRPIEFPAFGVDLESRGHVFQEYLEVFRKVQTHEFPEVNWSGGHIRNADMIPKPTTQELPFLITGSSRQPLEWISANSYGWINYPRPPQIQKNIIEDWQNAVARHAGNVFKPFSQSLYIDLTETATTPPKPIHLGYQLGRNALLELLQMQEEIGVNHTILNLKYGKRPASDVVEELGEFVLPNFSDNKIAAATGRIETRVTADID